MTKPANSVAVLLLLIGAAGCQNTLAERSLVFFTGTTMGLEVSASPSNPDGPVKLVIGYKRAEGVLDPVYNSNGVKTILNSRDTYGSSSATQPATCDPEGGGPQVVDRYLKQAYSVIAKMSGEADASAASSASGKIAVGQWFATGKAAEILAQQPGITGAVTGSAEIAAAAVAQRHYGINLTGVSDTDAITVLRFAYETLRSLKDDATAQKDADRLDALAASLVPLSYEVYDVSTDSTAVLTVDPKQTKLPITFDTLLKFKGVLEGSSNALNRALAGPPFTLRVKGSPDVTNVSKDTPEGKSLAQVAAKYKQDLEHIQTVTKTDPAVLAVFDYFVKAVTE